MRIPTGSTDRYLYFVAVDETDLKTREVGFGSTGWTVYRSRNGAAPALYTTPTITELSGANMPGLYALLIDEDTTLTAGRDSEEVTVHITHAGMAPVTRSFELYRPTKTEGEQFNLTGNKLSLAQLKVQSSGADAALHVEALGTGPGIEAIGAASAPGIRAWGGGTAGPGMHLLGQGSAAAGLLAAGVGTAAGIQATGGSGGGSGLAATGAGGGHGLAATGQGAGHGVLSTGGASGGAGVRATGGGSTGGGIIAQGNNGILANATDGYGIWAAGLNGDGILGTGNGSGSGARFYGGASGGNGMRLHAQGAGHGLSAEGGPTGDGIRADGGAGGVDMQLVNAAVSVGAQLDAAVSSRASAAALATVQADTDDIQTRLPAALISGRMDSRVGAVAAGVIDSSAAPNLDAAVSSRATPAQVAQALVDIHLDHLLAADYDPGAKPGVATALLNELVESDGSPPRVSRFTAGALAQAPSAGATDWSAGEREEIRGRLGITGTTAAGGNTPTLAEASAVANVQSRLPAALVSGRMDANMSAISDDAPAADALETMLDGTGGNKLSLSQLNIIAAGNDVAIRATGAGSGAGIRATGGTTGYGMICLAGGGGKAGLYAGGSGTNAPGIETEGVGGGADILLQSAALNLATAILARATPSDVATALTDIHLDHLLAATYDAAAKPGVADALLNEMVQDNGAGVTQYTATALAQGAGGGGLTQQNVRDAMLLAPTPGSPAAGSVDDYLAQILAEAQSIAAAGAAINQPAESFTLTTGLVVTGTVADTAAIDGVYHQIEDTAGALDAYYEFDVGLDGIPTSVTVVGRLVGQNDTLAVFAWNWATSSWQGLGTYAGQAGTPDVKRSYDLLINHVGTGPNDGLVRVRFFAGSGLSAADLYVDQVFVSYATIVRSAGYEGGAVWVDTVNGVTGTTPFIDGTADRPVATLAEAISLANAVGLRTLRFMPDSSIVLSQTFTGWVFTGARWSVALNGQQIDSCLFERATVSGNATTSSPAERPKFEDCRIQTCTLPPFRALRCSLEGVVTLNAAGEVYASECYTSVAGSLDTAFDAGVAVGNSTINLRHYSGGVEFRNLGQAGTDGVFIEGFGRIIIAASCVGGTVTTRGHFTVQDDSGGAVTLVDGARFTRADVAAAVATQMASAPVGSVAGDVLGRLLGGGVSAFAGVGARADLREWLGSAPNALQSGRVDSRPAAIAPGLIDTVAAPNLDAAVSSRASAAALATVQSDTDDIQTRLPAALVGGRMDSSVGAMSAAAIAAIWDELFSAARVAGGIGAGVRLSMYQGAVWLNTSAANTNTVLGVDGTPSKPVSTSAAVETLLASTGLRRVVVQRGTFTPTAALTAILVEAAGDQFNAAVNLNSQAHNRCLFRGLNIQGTVSGSASNTFVDCLFVGVTVPTAQIYACRVLSTLTAVTSLSALGCGFEDATVACGAYGAVLHDCFGDVTLTSQPGAVVTVATIRGGQVTLNNTWTAGTLRLRGWAKIINNTAGTVVDDQTGSNQNLDAAVSSRASAAALAAALAVVQADLAVVQGDTDDIQARLPAALVSGRIDAHVGSLDVGVRDALVDQTWDELRADHLNPGSTGEALGQGGGGGVLTVYPVEEWAVDFEEVDEVVATVEEVEEVEAFLVMEAS